MQEFPLQKSPMCTTCRRMLSNESGFILSFWRWCSELEAKIEWWALACSSVDCSSAWRKLSLIDMLGPSKWHAHLAAASFWHTFQEWNHGFTGWWWLYYRDAASSITVGSNPNDPEKFSLSPLSEVSFYIHFSRRPFSNVMQLMLDDCKIESIALKSAEF